MEFKRATIPGVMDTKADTHKVKLRLTGEIDLDGVIFDIGGASEYINQMSDIEFLNMIMDELEGMDV